MEPQGTWTPQSWQDRTAKQQPSWPDLGALDSSLKQISTMPPLVFAGEARSLQAEFVVSDDLIDGVDVVMTIGTGYFDAFNGVADALTDGDADTVDGDG